MSDRNWIRLWNCQSRIQIPNWIWFLLPYDWTLKQQIKHRNHSLLFHFIKWWVLFAYAWCMHTILFLISQSLTVVMRTRCLVFSYIDIDEWRFLQASIPILGVETMFKPKRLVIIWYVDVLHNWGLLEMTRALPRCPVSRLMNGRAVCWVCWAVSCFALLRR